MTDDSLYTLYNALNRWPKIGALVGEAQTNSELRADLMSDDRQRIMAALKARDIKEDELRSFVEDLEPWVPDVAQRSWYALKAQ